VTPSNGDLEREFERLLRDPLTRRNIMKRGAAGVLSASAIAYLAACGTDEPSSGNGGQSAGDEKTIPKGKIATSMYFANWPLYIDEKRTALKSFQQKYGTKIKYVEEVNDNDQFFGKVRQQYEQGSSGGRDIHVVTDWMADRMIQLGYVQKFDKSTMPNADANLIERLKSPPFDPNRDFSMPWQSGLTGIIYRKDLVKRTPKSVEDLFDPAYKGKVTMLTEMRDTVGLVAAWQGADPEKASVDEFMKAIDKIQQEVDSGQVRGFTGNEYLKDIPKGDSVIIFGWSGDAVQLKADNPNIDFVLPESGGMLWTDNMQIPVGAPHAFTAEKFIDYVYQPEVQAPIEAYVNYICPVNGTKEVIAKTDKALADNPLIFPDEAFLADTHIFRGLKPEEETELNDAFQKLIGA
jgi:spermidine/putrescine transport system substrate-binding protein